MSSGAYFRNFTVYERVDYLSFRSVKRLTEEICDCKIVKKKITGFWFLYIKMTVHVKQLTGKMHVRSWTSGRSLTACTKFYCHNVMLQLRLEIYFSHKTNQTDRKCHMHITFDCQQMLCTSLYLLPLQIWMIMMQMCKFMIQPNI